MDVKDISQQQTGVRAFDRPAFGFGKACFGAAGKYLRIATPCIRKKTGFCLTGIGVNAIIALSIYRFSTLKHERDGELSKMYYQIFIRH